VSMQHNIASQTSSSHPGRATDEALEASDTLAARSVPDTTDVVEIPDTWDARETNASSLLSAMVGEQDESASASPPYYGSIPWLLARRTPLRLPRHPFWPGVARALARGVVQHWLSVWRQLRMRWRAASFQRRAFHWSERRGRQEAWHRLRMLLPIALATTLLFVTASTFAIIVAARTATHPPLHLPVPPNVSPQGGVALQQPSATLSPTPDPTVYQIGAWVSDFSPPPGGTVHVYVRVSANDQPVPDIAVTLTVNATRHAPATTDAYGLAIFTVSYGGFGGRPVFVTATATIGGRVLTQVTTFVPG
jgi:hypothetical protein